MMQPRGGMHAFTDNVLAMDKGGARKVSPYFVPMMIANIAAGTVAIRFKAKGVCVPIVTACATGSHSIGEAFHAIKNGYADAIIAGGAKAAMRQHTAIMVFLIMYFLLLECLSVSYRSTPR